MRLLTILLLGYKEFAPYLEKTLGKSRDEIINDESLHEVLAECLKQLKSNTRYYARRQTAWIKNRLASVTQTSIYCLNATELTNWDSSVCVPAINICKGKSITIFPIFGIFMAPIFIKFV